MGQRRQRPIDATVFDAVRRGCAAVGLDPDYLSGDDVLLLWDRGRSVDDIVKTALAHAARTGDRARVAAP